LTKSVTLKRRTAELILRWIDFGYQCHIYASDRDRSCGFPRTSRFGYQWAQIRSRLRYGL